MSKPYGRFHVLPDFDEGKRSCWRKLESHNNIRKRKPVDKGGVASKQQKVNRFHVLPDFDEGKHSCWRKLERHNNRRKRKPVDKGGVASKQQQVNRYKSYYHVSV
ncbi:hypothetical protein DY000_02051426 [Brassica cretica]|uniref:SBP-type domain-containing protein n=1 Tax=Brassica cretica TaxID=69181 RepID=A0ABQ7F032_BRACR|nr:hypothetical protein DY000_02051426 [Brassica cretica]